MSEQHHNLEETFVVERADPKDTSQRSSSDTNLFEYLEEDFNRLQMKETEHSTSLSGNLHADGAATHNLESDTSPEKIPEKNKKKKVGQPKTKVPTKGNAKNEKAVSEEQDLDSLKTSPKEVQTKRNQKGKTTAGGNATKEKHDDIESKPKEEENADDKATKPKKNVRGKQTDNKKNDNETKNKQEVSDDNSNENVQEAPRQNKKTKSTKVVSEKQNDDKQISNKTKHGKNVENVEDENSKKDKSKKLDSEKQIAAKETAKNKPDKKEADNNVDTSNEVADKKDKKKTTSKIDEEKKEINNKEDIDNKNKKEPTKKTGKKDPPQPEDNGSVKPDSSSALKWSLRSRDKKTPEVDLKVETQKENVQKKTKKK